MNKANRLKIKLQCPILFEGQKDPSLEVPDDCYVSLLSTLTEIESWAHSTRRHWPSEFWPAVYRVTFKEGRLQFDLDFSDPELDKVIRDHGHVVSHPVSDSGNYYR